MVTQSFSSPCWEDTFPDLGRHLKACFCPCQLQGEKGPAMAATLRQEAGTGRSSCSVHSRISTKECSQWPLTVPFTERNNTGWQTWGNLPWWHKKEPTLTSPCSGGCVQGVIYKSQTFHVCPTGVFPIRITSARAQGHFHNMQLCCQLQFAL